MYPFMTVSGVRSSWPMTATKSAVKNMLDYLTKQYGLTREDAYVLCSVAADLRIHEVVDQPNWVVGSMIPLDIFP